MDSTSGRKKELDNASTTEVRNYENMRDSMALAQIRNYCYKKRLTLLGIAHSGSSASFIISSNVVRTGTEELK